MKEKYNSTHEMKLKAKFKKQLEKDYGVELCNIVSVVKVEADEYGEFYDIQVFEWIEEELDMRLLNTIYGVPRENLTSKKIAPNNK